MLKTLWQKIKQNRLLLMVFCCLALIILVFGFFFLFKGNSSNWIWLVILPCLILHIWMMKGHKHNDSYEEEEDKKNRLLYKCPECGLEYEEKSWAEKCEAWCKEHKTCNVEITSHAVKMVEKDKN